MIHQKIYIKPLSVNEAYSGRRTRTIKYKKFAHDLMLLIGKYPIKSDSNLSIIYRFGFSSNASDTDNCIKQLQDILSKKYNFNDKNIKRFYADSEIVSKGYEYLEFKIFTDDEMQLFEENIIKIISNYKTK